MINEGNAAPQPAYQAVPINQVPVFQQPVSGVPPAPRHRSITGPLLDMSSGLTDPALNNIHHSHIAHREQAGVHRQAQPLA